jgi:hypothetical protein
MADSTTATDEQHAILLLIRDKVAQHLKPDSLVKLTVFYMPDRPGSQLKAYVGFSHPDSPQQRTVHTEKGIDLFYLVPEKAEALAERIVELIREKHKEWFK